MLKVTMWKTLDGKVFADFEEAKTHEEKYKAAWMQDALINPAAALEKLDDDDRDEFYGTTRQLAETAFDAIMQARHGNE
jgi:hypothetical protein